MRRILPPLLAAILLVACGGPELEGTWTIHPDSAADMIKAVPDVHRAEAFAAAKQITMTFDDGKCTMSVPNLGKREGTYTIKSTDGNKLTVEMEFEGNKDEQVFEIEGDTLTATIAGGQFKLIRAK
jgi:major membrane immunogen (membrane-anchored lipoprotein)